MLLLSIGVASAALAGAAAADAQRYRCVAAPHVSPPPSTPTPLTAPDRRLCPRGKAPKIAGAREAKLIPDVVHAARRQKANPGYHYVSYYDFATAVGTYADITVAHPVLDPRDSHTLGEVAAQSQDGEQIVEIGWTVDPAVNGGDGRNPHLFVFHWVNGVGRGYNGFGFVPASGATIVPGMQLPVTDPPTAHRFTIEHFEGNWWVRYDSEWVGYFPDGEWTAPTFTQIGLAQWFGEVADSLDGLQCTQMGTGAFGSSPAGGTIGATSTDGTFGTPYFIDASNTAFRSSPALSVTPASGYDGRARTGGFGGPGPCAAPPQTRILRHPPQTIRTRHRWVSVTFSFTADTSGSRFTCSRDGGAPSACGSPLTYRTNRGSHTFSVFATDSLGRAGPVRNRTFTVVRKHRHRR